MRKIFISSLFMSVAVAMGETTLTTVATMDDLITKATSVTAERNTSYTNDTVYSFSNDKLITGIADETLSNVFFSGDQFVTVAAWIKADSLSNVQAIFSYGGQNTGIKFTLKNANLAMTTKGDWDFASGSQSVTAGEWTLVAFTLGAQNNSSSNFRYYVSETDGSYTQNPLNGSGTPETWQHSWKAASGEDAKFAIGTGNANSSREPFTGEIANLTIFTSSELANNSEIAKAIGAAPSLNVPEPATASLTLLALGAWVLRRRRK